MPTLALTFNPLIPKHAELILAGINPGATSARKLGFLLASNIAD